MKYMRQWGHLKKEPAPVGNWMLRHPAELERLATYTEFAGIRRTVWKAKQRKMEEVGL